MGSAFKVFDRVLTFITNNKLIQLLLPLLFAGGFVAVGMGSMETAERLSNLEATSEKPEKPAKTITILQETPNNCKDDHVQMKLDIQRCLNHVDNH